MRRWGESDRCRTQILIEPNSDKGDSKFRLGNEVELGMRTGTRSQEMIFVGLCRFML